MPTCTHRTRDAGAGTGKGMRQTGPVSEAGAGGPVTYEEVVSNVVKGVEAVGASILVLGGLGALIAFALAWPGRPRGRVPT